MEVVGPSNQKSASKFDAQVHFQQVLLAYGDGFVVVFCFLFFKVPLFLSKGLRCVKGE